jgi:hypothetical protein
MQTTHQYYINAVERMPQYPKILIDSQFNKFKYLLNSGSVIFSPFGYIIFQNFFTSAILITYLSVFISVCALL